MVKCGKGCMPECEYFTTGGCISPFNCPYKIETGYINTATSVIGSYTQGKDDLNEPKIKKWFRSLVDEGKIQQEPMNYDAATLQIYIDHLEKENAALRERLDITKMALEYACLETLQSNEQYLEELKEKVNKYIKQAEDVVYGQKNGATFIFAEARLVGMKGGKE